MKPTEKFTISGRCEIDSDLQAVVIASFSDGSVCGIDVVNNGNASKSSNNANILKVNYAIQIPTALLVEKSQLVVNVVLYNRTIQTLKTVYVSDLVSQWEHFQENESPAIHQLFPSLGFFGDAKNSRLVWQVKRITSELTVTVNAKKSILNIGGIVLITHGNKRLRHGVDFTAQYSSSEPPQADPARVFADKGFHSAQEDYPFIKIIFIKPVYLTKVTIRNRSDKWGCRAKHLIIRQSLHGESEAIYCPNQDYLYLHKLAQKLESFGIDMEQVNNLQDDPIAQRIYALNCAVKYCNENPLSLSPKTQKCLLEMLSTWSTRPKEAPLVKLELEVLGLVLANQLKQGLQLNLLPFVALLNSTKLLDQLETHINANLQTGGHAQIKLTKHGVAKKGELVENIDVVMQTLIQVMTLLEQLDYQPCIAYGTLLGAYRDKGFIAHDDDVDILIKLSDQELSFAQALELRDAMIAKLPQDQYRVEYGNPENINIHLYCRKTNVMIDIFPYWFNQGHVHLYMEKMKIRPIDASIFATRTPINLYGQEVYAPEKIEQFLLERYGPNWHISDKYHEWPWVLTDAQH